MLRMGIMSDLRNCFAVDDIATAPNRPPRPGDRWRMNLFRVDRRPEVAELAWSPTLQDDFHILRRFGELVFADREVPRKPPTSRRLHRVKSIDQVQP